MYMEVTKIDSNPFDQNLFSIREFTKNPSSQSIKQTKWPNSMKMFRYKIIATRDLVLLAK